MRKLILAACGALLLGGCGGIASGTNPVQNSHTLTIYSSLPLQGPDHARQQQILDGEKLALLNAGGRAGAYHVSFYSLDDSDPSRGSWTPDITSQAARMAAQDNNAIAYVGDFDSGATAISLPLVNEAGILQISPGSPYIGLTQTDPSDGKGEPDRYYPTGQRTFARLVPSDDAQALALLSYMHDLGVHRLYVIEDLDVFDAAVATSAAQQAPGQGITLAAPVAELNTRTNLLPAGYEAAAKTAAALHPDAVLIGAAPSPGAEALWRALHAALPGAKLFAPSELAAPEFLQNLSPDEAAATYVTSPVLEPRFYPPAARRVLRQYRTVFGSPGTAYALYGYEAVDAALAAIRAAGRHGGSRSRVVHAFFRLRDRRSVLGTYSVMSDGDVTLSQFGGYTVGSGGTLRWSRLLSG